MPVRQWVLSLPIPLRLLLAAQPVLVTPVLQVVHRVITHYLLGQAGEPRPQAGRVQAHQTVLASMAVSPMASGKVWVNSNPAPRSMSRYSPSRRVLGVLERQQTATLTGGGDAEAA